MYTAKIFRALEEQHSPVMLELLSNYTQFQQLIATMLSSRTKDSTTIPLVKKLFKKHKTPQSFIKAKHLEKELYGIGFYKVKAKNIKKLSKIIIKKFHGKVPDKLTHLISLPGVGRKTANCVLSYTFKQPAIAVDVHVHRISNRLGWVKTKDPEETEEELKKIIPKKNWSKINKLFVNHGQHYCLPRKPRCAVCIIRWDCKFGKKAFLFNTTQK